MAIEKLERHTTGCSSPAEWIKVGSRTILFGIRRNCLTSGRGPSLYLFIRRMIKETAVYRGLLFLSST